MRRSPCTRARSGSAAPCAAALLVNAGAIAPKVANPAPALRTSRRELAGGLRASPFIGSDMADLPHSILWFSTLWLADQHGGDPGQERQRDRDRSTQPDHARRHHVD